MNETTGMSNKQTNKTGKEEAGRRDIYENELRYHDKPLELIREFGKVNTINNINMQKSIICITNKNEI